MLLPVDETAKRDLNNGDSEMRLQRPTTERQPAATDASDSRAHLGTSITNLPPLPHNLLLNKHLRQFCNLFFIAPIIKREELASMTQPYAYHNHFLSSEELVTTDKSKNTLSLINNVNDKTKFERTCVACVLYSYFI